MQNPSHLVSPDYYDQEIQFQEKIDARQRARELGTIILEPENEKLAITFPKGFAGQNARGTVLFYKPDNPNLDQVFELDVNDSNQHLIDMNALIPGRWDIKIQAAVDEQRYYWEETINL
jgi:hypothetical protein